MNTEEMAIAAETKDKTSNPVDKPWKSFARYNGASLWSRFWEDFHAAFSPRFKQSRELAGKQMDFYGTCDAMRADLQALTDPTTTGDRLRDVIRSIRSTLEADTLDRGEALGKQLGLSGVAARTVDEILDTMALAIRNNPSPEIRARIIRSLNPNDSERCLDILRSQAAGGKTNEERTCAIRGLAENPDLESASISKEVLTGEAPEDLRNAASQLIASFAGSMKAQALENPNGADSLVAFAESVIKIPDARESSPSAMADREPLLEAKLSMVNALFDINVEHHGKRFRLRENRPGLEILTRTLADAGQPFRVQEAIVELANRSMRHLVEHSAGMSADVTAFLAAADAKRRETNRLRETSYVRTGPAWAGLEPAKATVFQEPLQQLRSLVDRSRTLTANLHQIPESPMQYRELVDKKAKTGGCSEIFRGAVGARGELEHYYFRDAEMRWYWLELAGPRTSEEDREVFEILKLPYPKTDEDVNAALARVRGDKSELVGEPDGRVFGIRQRSR